MTRYRIYHHYHEHEDSHDEKYAVREEQEEKNRIWHKKKNMPVKIEGKASVGNKEYSAEFTLPYQKAFNAVMAAEGFCDYVKVHGWHFTEELAEWASKMMLNVEDEDVPESERKNHSWSCEEVDIAVESLRLKTNAPIGDLTYEANKIYSDNFGNALEKEATCIKIAVANSTDPDGYDGQIFCRWLADVIGKNMKVDWNAFV